jgi:acyl-CoA thioesterase
MDNVRKLMDNDQFAEFCGIELLEISSGSAKTKLEIKKEHINGVGIVHGGIIFTLADFTFAAASNSHGNIALAINANISYVKAAQANEILFAHAIESSISPKLATYTVNVINKANELIAIFNGMVYRKKDTIKS